MRYLLIGAALVILLPVSTFLIADTFRGLELERSIELSRDVDQRLQIGMTRTEVQQAVGSDAKKRYRCNSADVFLIGSPDPGRASMMYLAYRDEPDGTQVLERVAGVDQSMIGEFTSCPASSP